jgi:FAD binding domain-containing protein
MCAVRRRFALGLAGALAMGLLWLSTFVVEYDRWLLKADPLDRPDVARLLPAKVGRVERIRDLEQMRALLREARDKGLKVSIAGSRHSQGGQTYTDGALVFDMKGFNRILALDEKAKTLTAQAGATWDDVQHYVSPHGLAVKVMQSSYVFTLGGTLSANAHGRDIATALFLVARRRSRAQGESGVTTRESNGWSGTSRSSSTATRPRQMSEESAASAFSVSSAVRWAARPTRVKSGWSSTTCTTPSASTRIGER